MEEGALGKRLHILAGLSAQARVLPESAVGDGRRHHPAVHVARSGHNLGGGHLLHGLERLLALRRVQVAGRSLARHLKQLRGSIWHPYPEGP